MPLVSIITPTYNRANAIGKTIESVLAQTFTDFEMIISDDGSTDDTAEIVAGYAARDSRIIWLPCEQNSGRPAVPRNRALKIAKGEWLAFLDSDDEWLPEKLEKQMEVVVVHDVSAVCTNGIAWRGDKDDSIMNFEKFNRIYNLDDLLKSNSVICSSALIKKDLVIGSGGFPENVFFRAIEDYYLWLKCACETHFFYLPEPLIKYHDQPMDSVRKNFTGNQRSLDIKMIKIFLIFFCWQLANRYNSTNATVTKKNIKLKIGYIVDNFKAQIKRSLVNL